MEVHKRRELNYKEPIKACRKKIKTRIVGCVIYFIQNDRSGFNNYIRKKR